MHVPQTALPDFAAFCKANSEFWSTTFSDQADETAPVVLADMFHNDYHYNLRALMLANYVRHCTGGRLLAACGVGGWMPKEHNIPQLSNALASSYGAFKTEIMNLEALAANSTLSEIQSQWIDALDRKQSLSDGMKTLAAYQEDDGLPLGQHILENYFRYNGPFIEKHNSSTAGLSVGETNLAEQIALGFAVFNWLKNMVASYDIKSLVSGHHAYLPYAVLAELVLRQGGEVLIYSFQFNDVALWRITPERFRAFQAQNPGRPTYLITADIDEDLFSRIKALSPDKMTPKIESVCQFLNVSEFQNPWWWKESALEVQNAVNRILSQLDSQEVKKPVIAIYAHQLSEVTIASETHFQDVYEWFEQTLKYAHGDDSKIWIIKPHPSSPLYGEQGRLDHLREKYQASHMIFLPPNINGATFTPYVDGAVTIVGTLGYQMTRQGIPVLHAGKGGYTKLGFSLVSESQEDYFEKLSKLGETPVSEEARYLSGLYYFYRRSLIGSASVFLGPYEQFYTKPEAEHALFWRNQVTRLKRYHIREDELYRNIEYMYEKGLERPVNLAQLADLDGNGLV